MYFLLNWHLVCDVRGQFSGYRANRRDIFKDSDHVNDSVHLFVRFCEACFDHSFVSGYIFWMWESDEDRSTISTPCGHEYTYMDRSEEHTTELQSRGHIVRRRL